ncbi:hypothetical protein [Catellatospora sp. NPDC049133]|uniref:hypothetical protein n=1 Tax=Catellatospora sp. NPDC049133 TaxID=3155499 RepID=UPI0033DD6892
MSTTHHHDAPPLDGIDERESYARRRVPRAVVALAIVAAVGAAAMVVRTIRETGDQADTAHAVPASSPLPLSALLNGQPSDADGSVTYLHIRTWDIADATRDVLATYDEQLWWHPDGSALAKRCLVIEPATMNRLANQPAASCPPGHRAEPGQWVPRLAGPPSTDRETLRRQLDAYDTGDGPEHVVRAVAALCREHLLDPRQRSAALSVLADVPGLKWHGLTQDRVGRQGAAVTLDTGDPAAGMVRDILLIDPASGHLLGYEQIAMTPPPGSHLKPESVVKMIVYLEGQWAAALPQ